MSHSTSNLHGLAERLIEFDAIENKNNDDRTSCFFACERLRSPLTHLMGAAGFHALLARSQVLAKEEAGWLQTIRLNPDGSFEGLDEALLQQTPDEQADGKVAMLTQLLGLLVAFIGVTLTMNLVSQIWPNFPLDASSFEDTEKQ